MMTEKYQHTAAAAFATCCVMKKIILLAFASLYLMCVRLRRSLYVILRAIP